MTHDTFAPIAGAPAPTTSERPLCAYGESDADKWRATPSELACLTSWLLVQAAWTSEARPTDLEGEDTPSPDYVPATAPAQFRYVEHQGKDVLVGTADGRWFRLTATEVEGPTPPAA